MDSIASNEQQSMKMMARPELKHVSAFRRLLPQFLASSAKNFLIWNLGLILAFPSIVISTLTGFSTALNPNEPLRITAAQASWLASSVFIGQPIGSIFSAFLTDAFGRKKALLLVNIPNIIAWILLAETNSLPLVFLAFILFGIGAGLMVYLGEICEPSIRGFLSACAGIASSMGILMVFLLGSLFSWRQVALICSIIPITTMIAVFFVPESPIWLLSKNKPKQAMKSLQWLRGWVSSDAVCTEFSELQRYNEFSSSCPNCKKQSVNCIHPGPSLWDKIKDIKHPRTLKPFILITILYILMEFSGMFVMRPYIVQILNAYGIPLDAHLTTVILGALGVFANICLLSTIKLFGKRKIYLCSTVITFLSCFALSIYGFCSLPSGWTSFRAYLNETSTSHSSHIKDSMDHKSYVPLYLFLVQHFAISIGVSSMANIYMGEVFPFKSRSFLCGIAAANRYILAMIATKTYYNIEIWLSLPGSMAFYGSISLIGFIIMYHILPETEGRSLEDIELYYSNDEHRITDINIRINK